MRTESPEVSGREAGAGPTVARSTHSPLVDNLGTVKTGDLSSWEDGLKTHNLMVLPRPSRILNK